MKSKIINKIEVLNFMIKEGDLDIKRLQEIFLLDEIEVKKILKQERDLRPIDIVKLNTKFPFYE